jgi:hypothetical protein
MESELFRKWFLRWTQSFGDRLSECGELRGSISLDVQKHLEQALAVIDRDADCAAAETRVRENVR